jgi:hypothetical protein
LRKEKATSTTSYQCRNLYSLFSILPEVKQLEAGGKEIPPDDDEISFSLKASLWNIWNLAIL